MKLLSNVISQPHIDREEKKIKSFKKLDYSKRKKREINIKNKLRNFRRNYQKTERYGRTNRKYRI